MKYILAIAGSDSCGGAGIQADIKTITALGAHALTVVTAVTAQNSRGIRGVHKVPARFARKQLEAILNDLIPHSVKIGMLYSEAMVKEMARVIRRFTLPRVVLDPVLRASTGARLIEPRAMSVLKENLLPLTRVITPNVYEAEVFSGMKIKGVTDMVKAAEAIRAFGPDVVITGGHLRGRCVDMVYDGQRIHKLSGSRIATKHTHGSGCVFSTALATLLAEENDVILAAIGARDFTRCAIRDGYACGRAAGPVRVRAILPPATAR